MPDPHDEPATLADDEIETRPIGGADPRLADDTGDDSDSGDDTGDDTGDVSDTSDTGDDSGDSGDDS